SLVADLRPDEMRCAGKRAVDIAPDACRPVGDVAADLTMDDRRAGIRTGPWINHWWQRLEGEADQLRPVLPLSLSFGDDHADQIAHKGDLLGIEERPLRQLASFRPALREGR